MIDFTFITGNQRKADYLAQYLGGQIDHLKLNLDELQSLDLYEIVEHKVKQAYAIVKKPVIVEDVSLVFDALGKLPGPLIKWFLEELKVDGLCKNLDNYEDRSATAQILFAYYDGQEIKYFYGESRGTVATKPRGDFGFGWNAVFIPEGSDKTFAEMPDKELAPFSHRAKAVEKLKAFLTTLE